MNLVRLTRWRHKSKPIPKWQRKGRHRIAVKSAIRNAYKRAIQETIEELRRPHGVFYGWNYFHLDECEWADKPGVGETTDMTSIGVEKDHMHILPYDDKGQGWTAHNTRR